MEKKYQKQNFGITTGTAATAAAVAAFLSLSHPVDTVKIKAPFGELFISVHKSKKIDSNTGWASIIKMPYPDPDVTQNLEIIAQLRLEDTPGIHITGGDGVGTVTKPGLQVPVGKSAINPVPQQMIKENLQKILPSGKGATVTINVPKGREVALKTMNPRLGIVDGISILGTTGIARPMSCESYQQSLKCQLDVALAEGYKTLIFVPGNIGQKMALQILDVDEDQIIQMGNQVGFMLREAYDKGVKNIIILGHAGKLVKISAGIFNTEHKIADGRREVITAHSALIGANKSLITDIYHCNTTEDMIAILEENNLTLDVFNSIAQAGKNKVNEVFHLVVELIILKMDGKILNNNYKLPEKLK